MNSINKELKIKYLKEYISSKKYDNFQIKENSNSNDYVQLEKDGKDFVIKKTWFDPSRGFASIKKQIQFGELRLNSLIVRSPTVFYTQQVNDKEFIAKMEYVDGLSGGEIVKNGSRKISLSLKEALSIIVSKNIENSKIEKVCSKLFIDKIDKIQKNNLDDDFNQMLIFLKNKFNDYKIIELPLGPCHGDLTLSNIIVSPTGSLNLIDFLPSFIETPIWDIVKIYQDLKYGWSYRNLKGPRNASAKLFFQSCIPNQLSIYNKVWRHEILLLNALNLSRLIPYIKDVNTKKWVLSKLRESLKEIS